MSFIDTVIAAIALKLGYMAIPPQPPVVPQKAPAAVVAPAPIAAPRIVAPVRLPMKFTASHYPVKCTIDSTGQGVDICKGKARLDVTGAPATLAAQAYACSTLWALEREEGSPEEFLEFEEAVVVELVGGKGSASWVQTRDVSNENDNILGVMSADTDCVEIL